MCAASASTTSVLCTQGGAVQHCYCAYSFAPCSHTSSSAASSAFNQKARFFRFCAACMSVCCGSACKHCSGGPTYIRKPSYAPSQTVTDVFSWRWQIPQASRCMPESFPPCEHRHHNLAGIPPSGSSAAALGCHCDLKRPPAAPAAHWAVAAVHWKPASFAWMPDAWAVHASACALHTAAPGQQV